MDQPNVNNLNGIPNFGHGFQDVIDDVVIGEPIQEETPEEDEEVEISNPEETE